MLQSNKNKSIIEKVNWMILFTLIVFRYISSKLVKWLIATYHIKLTNVETFLISDFFIILIPLLFVLINRINIFKFIQFKLLKPFDILLSIGMAFAMSPLMSIINWTSLLFFDLGTKAIAQNSVDLPLWLQLLIIAVGPGIIEELIFRGVTFHAYRPNGLLGATLYSAIFFALAHGNMNQFLYTIFMGFVMALEVEATGSIFASMITHFTLNGSSVLVQYGLKALQNSLPKPESTTVVLDETLYFFGGVFAGQTLLMAVGGVVLAYIIFKTMLKRSGRTDYFTYQIYRGFGPQNNERFVTEPYIMAAGFIVLLMLNLALS